jgi:hypothetical protein
VANLNRDDTSRFRSSQTGFTFADLYQAIVTLRTVDLDMISSYVTVNTVTKDKTTLLDYYNYQIERLVRERTVAQDKLNSINIFDPKLMLGATAMGFGNAIQLLLMPPFVLLFSYTRTHKNKLIDIFIPIVGIACILIIYLQGSFQILQIMPKTSINLDKITELLKQVKVVVTSLSVAK